MKKYINKLTITAAISFILFIVLTILIQYVDVQSYGPNNEYSIGLYTINSAYASLFTYSKILDDITDLILLGCVGIGSIATGIGIYQWIKRKNIFKVDREILGLGIFYLVLLGQYLVFEALHLNYRPYYAVDAEIEASYPSSHVLCISGLLISALVLISKYVKNRKLQIALCIADAILLVIAVVFKAICGVHWLTDIIGGFLLAITFICIYFAFGITKKAEKQ